MSNEHKKIENLHEKLIYLIKSKLNVTLNEYSFCNSGTEVRFHYGGMNLKLIYNEKYDLYQVYHLNTAKNSGGAKERYHHHFKCDNLNLINTLNRIKTCHDMSPKYTNMVDRVKSEYEESRKSKNGK